MLFIVCIVDVYLQLKKCVFLSYCITMTGAHICSWLKNGSVERCSKRCINTYCHTHRQQLRLGRKPPVSCRRCGAGTKSVTLLCLSCGSHKAAQKLIDTERRARRDFSRVLTNLKNPIRQMTE